MKKVSRTVAFIITGIILIATFRFLWNSSRPETTTYEIITPVLGDIENTTTVTGNIEPRNETAVKPEIRGIITRILKETGQVVKEGDIIATLRVIPEAGDLSTAESHLRITKITLEQVSKEYERQKELFENDVISKNEFEITEAKYRRAVEENENAEDCLEIVRTGSSKKSNTIDNTQIRSRSSGTILDIPVKTGNTVIQSNPFHEGTTIAVVANMNDLIFRGTIDESEVGKIREGMPISISVGAIPNETIDAVLEQIASKGKKESGTVLYEIKAAIKTPKTTLIRANYSANAFLKLEQVKNVIKIPESSVEFNKNGSTYVYVLNGNHSKTQTFIKKPIEIGLSDGNHIEVKNGITLSDKIRGIRIDTPSK